MLWACRELGVDFSFSAIDWAAKEHKSDAFLKLSPLGQLPAFQDGELVLTESGAIILYLAEKHGAGCRRTRGTRHSPLHLRRDAQRHGCPARI